MTGAYDPGGCCSGGSSVSSQLDADRADYLLRDSYHLGVDYGRYDLRRLIATLTVVEDPEAGGPLLAIEEGGWHAAESLLWARYQMFTQVYLHKTRVAYDLHVGDAMAELLRTQQANDGLAEAGRFPPPTDEANLRRYLRWTDWRALSLMEQGVAGVHGDRLLKRQHHRTVYETREVMDDADRRRLGRVLAALRPLDPVVRSAYNSWYKPDQKVQVARGAPPPLDLVGLSWLSGAVRQMAPSEKQIVYVPFAQAREARRIVRRVSLHGGREP